MFLYALLYAKTVPNCENEKLFLIFLSLRVDWLLACVFLLVHMSSAVIVL